MYCHRCGRVAAAGYRFCPQCGGELPVAVDSGVNARMDTHVKILAIVYILYNVIALLGSLVLLLTLGTVGHLVAGLIGAGPDTMRILEGLLGSMGLLLVLESVAGIFGGLGLLQYRLWARTLTILLSLINLLHIPFGTALGIYGLWVLLSSAGERHYQQLARATG